MDLIDKVLVVLGLLLFGVVTMWVLGWGPSVAQGAQWTPCLCIRG